MADSGAIESRLGRSASGCAVYFVLFVVVAYGLDHFMGERLIPEARPWVGMASALFTTLGIASIWGLLTGYTRPASAHSSRDLILEETVLAVGATATVAGPWSATRQAIVPHIEGMDALTVNATTGGAEKIHLDDAGVPPSTFAGVVTALLLLAMGAGVLGGAMVLLAAKTSG